MDGFRVRIRIFGSNDFNIFVGLYCPMIFFFVGMTSVFFDGLYCPMIFFFVGMTSVFFVGLYCPMIFFFVGPVRVNARVRTVIGEKQCVHVAACDLKG